MQEWLINPRQICLWVSFALGLCLSAAVVRADDVAPVAFATQLAALLDQERAALQDLDPGYVASIMPVSVSLALNAEPAALPLPQPRPKRDFSNWRAGLSLFSGKRPVEVAAIPTEELYANEWLASQPKAHGDQQWACLTEALYFESRGEPPAGQFAVAEVILNRVEANDYPATICGVVRQGSGASCQFSFYCDGHPETIAEPAAYERAGKIAALMLAGAPRDLTDGATHFHTVAVKPHWAQVFDLTASIGVHKFYRAPLRLASN